MLTEFSSGYYLARLYVEPTSGDRATVQRRLLERANEQLYAVGEGIERLDVPLVVKLGTSHFPVYGADGIPAGTLEVPESVLDDRIRHPPTLREVLVAKAHRSAQLVRMFGHRRPGRSGDG